MHQTYVRSLCPIPLSPAITSLDLPRRVETMPNGEVIERTTREWATSLNLLDGSPARCDVVNGTQVNQTFLLVPSQHLNEIKESVRNYRLRINVLGQRKSRFCDSLPGLPAEIQFDPSTQANLTFLENLSSADIWNQAPPGVRATPAPPCPLDLTTPIPIHPSVSNPDDTETLWPPPSGPHHYSSQSTTATFESAAPSSHGGKSDSRYAHQTDNTTTAVSSQSDSTVMKDILSRLQAFDTLLQAQQLQISQVTSSTHDQFQQVDKRLQRLDNLDDTIIQRMNLHQVETMSVMKNQFADMMSHMASQLPPVHAPITGNLVSATAASAGPSSPITGFSDPTTPSNSGHKIPRDSASLHSNSTSSETQQTKKPRSIDNGMEHMSLASASTTLSDLGDIYSVPSTPPRTTPTPSTPPWSPPPADDLMSTAPSSPTSTTGHPDLNTQYTHSSASDGATEE